LVLDNFEQLVPEVEVVSRLLAASPESCVIVTSRVALDLLAEHRYPLRGLAYPVRGATSDPRDYSAVQLFVAAAQRTTPGFVLSSGDATHVGTICRGLEGSPLAIEMAAAWARILRPADIAERLRA